MARILLLNGPNLNLLGRREPHLYGDSTLADIEARAVEQVRERGHALDAYQTNAESDLIERIHEAARQDVAFIVLNPAGFTHTSVALRDALLAVDIPFIEVHLSNTAARETFRQRSYFSDIAVGCIVGFGPMGYRLALEAALTIIESNKTK